MLSASKQMHRKLLPQIFNTRMMSYVKALKKRFYKNVNIKTTPDGFLIQLDNKTIKTPLRNKLLAPTEELALAVAQEWHLQEEEIDMHSMPLTAICNTTIDNPTDITKLALVESMLEFLHTDTICTLADQPEELITLQTKHWRPIRNWFSDTYMVEVNATANLFQQAQSQNTIDTLKMHMLSMNKWQLNGLQTAIDSIQSFILPMAVLKRHISIEEAISLSRLELEFQIEKWGHFEQVHDMQKYGQQTLLAAGTLVYHFTSNVKD